MFNMKIRKYVGLSAIPLFWHISVNAKDYTTAKLPAGAAEDLKTINTGGLHLRAVGLRLLAGEALEFVRHCVISGIATALAQT